MYTEPKIVTTNDLKVRSYVTFYFNGKRVREYNGHNLDKKINPNYATTLDARNKLLLELFHELKNALKNNLYPIKKVVRDEQISTEVVLDAVLKKKLNSHLSHFYKRNLTAINKDFIKFLTLNERSNNISAITLARIEEFLSRFNSSGTYYMNKRRDLGVLFSAAGKALQTPLSIVKETATRRSKAQLHRIYERDQLKRVLAF